MSAWVTVARWILARSILRVIGPLLPERAIGCRSVGPRQPTPPARLAHRGHADDLDAEVEVRRHPPDDRELLPVLLAEDGQVRADGMEEFGHHGGHAAEVPRSRLPAERLAEPRHLDRRLEALRV